MIALQQVEDPDPGVFRTDRLQMSRACIRVTAALKEKSTAIASSASVEGIGLYRLPEVFLGVKILPLLIRLLPEADHLGSEGLVRDIWLAFFGYGGLGKQDKRA